MMPKTPDEIKKGLECCNRTFDACHDCPYDTYDEGWGCTVEKNADALALIRQLEAKVILVEQYRWERDVAIDQLKQLGVGFGEKVNGKLPHWNNVADKLPFYNTTVLCIDIDNKHVFIGNMLTSHLHQNKGVLCCAVQGLYGVRYAKYWMPLPEPPKEATEPHG